MISQEVPKPKIKYVQSFKQVNIRLSCLRRLYNMQRMFQLKNQNILDDRQN